LRIKVISLKKFFSDFTITINDYITLKLVNGKTFIYVKGK